MDTSSLADDFFFQMGLGLGGRRGEGCEGRLKSCKVFFLPSAGEKKKGLYLCIKFLGKPDFSGLVKLIVELIVPGSRPFGLLLSRRQGKILSLPKPPPPPPIEPTRSFSVNIYGSLILLFHS